MGLFPLRGGMPRYSLSGLPEGEENSTGNIQSAKRSAPEQVFGVTGMRPAARPFSTSLKEQSIMSFSEARVMATYKRRMRSDISLRHMRSAMAEW